MRQIENKYVDSDGGRLLFANTFTDYETLAKEIMKEKKGERDIVFYVDNPQVLIGLSPQNLFLDPSDAYRLDLKNFSLEENLLENYGFYIKKAESREEIKKANKVYKKQKMSPLPLKFLETKDKSTDVFIALDEQDRVVGVVVGIDHFIAFRDEQNGSSLWGLAVDPQARVPKIGTGLVNKLIYFYKEKGRGYLDLSVMSNNQNAKSLYKKMGFEQIQTFCVKKKNPMNEVLFTNPQPKKKLNPYAKLIVNEAVLRGVSVEISNHFENSFELTFGGRTVFCHESLTDQTSAIALKRCDDKSITNKILKDSNIKVPDQVTVKSFNKTASNFLDSKKSVVVKPAVGEQGNGISIDIKTQSDLKKAISKAKKVYKDIVVEEMHEGYDLRIIVINYQFVAAAKRKPPEITGTGVDNIKTLIKKQSRRRKAATEGESKIPIDGETKRCVEESGYKLDDIIEEGVAIQVRKTSNLYTGGTIHDVTKEVSQEIIDVAEKAARMLDIPVVGFDFLVDENGDYVLIEANERPGLANHEPQPVAPKFLDFLFPQSMNT